MALSIQTNIASLNAQRNLGKTTNMLNKSLQRLSSGMRINSAKDDAAGLAIANRMTAQVRGLDQAVRNANDGISLAQTAEGALQESGSILQRIRELAVQSSSDGSTDADRASMQIEVDQLISELDRIASDTSFNGKVLLDGTFSGARFQIGAEAGQSISMGLESARTNALGSTAGVASGDYTMAKETSTAGTFGTSGSMATLGAGELSLNGTEIRATLSGDDTVSSSDNAGSSIAVATAINASSSTTGVNAYAEDTTYTTSTAVSLTANVAADTLVLNGVNIGGITSGATLGASLDNAVIAINLQTANSGVVATEDGSDLTLTAVDGRNIQVEVGSADLASFLGGDFSNGDDKTIRGTVSLYSNEAITIAGTAPGNSGFTAGAIALDETHWLAQTTAFESLALGDLVINGYNVIAPTAAGDLDGDYTLSAEHQTASAKAITYAINNTTGLKEEVTATSKTVANLGVVSGYTGGLLDLTVNNQLVSFGQTILAGDSNGYMTGTLNAEFAAATANTDPDYGLVASINSSGELLITSDAGVNIDVAVTVAAGTSVLSEIADTVVNTHVVHKGTVSLEAKTGYVVSSIEGGKQALAGIETAVGTVAAIDISTYQGAQNALIAITGDPDDDSDLGALGQIDDMRAELGAIQNRFDSTIANLSNVSENLSAAKSRIMDADFAIETAGLTKAQILQQAGVAMLAQANMLPQTALSLLQ